MSHKQGVPVNENYRSLASQGGIIPVMFLMVAFSPFAVYGQPRMVRVDVYQNEPKIFMDEDGDASGVFI
jgi:hypothetical protein